MRKTKIAVLHAKVPFIQGGAELQVKMLVENLKKNDFDVELIQLPFKTYPENVLYDNLLAWRLLDLSEVDGEKIDLVIGTKFPSYGAVHDNKVVWLIHQFRQAYDLYDTPMGLSNVENGERIRGHIKLYDEKALGEAKALYSDSNNVSIRLKRYNGLKAEPLYHPPALFGRYQTGEYGEYILSVGRLDYLKRVDLLIRAVALTRKPVKAKIVGTGPKTDELKALAAALGVADRVEFLGFVSDDDIIDLYANAFAVYFAPVDEDYGYITLESFYSHKPTLTCHDSGGPLEFVRHMENGYICDPDPQEIAQGIHYFYENKERCKKLGQNGFEFIRGISWDNVIAKLTCTL